jgi:hypothetical protein
MSFSATPERSVPHHLAWPREKRESDCRACLDQAMLENRMNRLRPGFVAGTFGLTKDFVKSEMMKRNEACGSSK